MSTTPTQDEPSQNPTRKRRRRRSGDQDKQSQQQSSRQEKRPGNRQNRERSGNRSRSTRRQNSDRGSGGVYRVDRKTERPTPALWRRLLQVITFGVFRADPYFVPGSERFARTAAPTEKQPAEKNHRRSDSGERKQQSRRRRSSDQSESSEPNKPPRNSERTPEEVEVTSPRCFVGNLSYDVGESELNELFASVGSVATAELVMNSRSNRSKGYGFITMGSIEEAKAAVSRYNGHELMGRKMVVSGAKSSGPKTAENTTAD